MKSHTLVNSPKSHTKKPPLTPPLDILDLINHGYINTNKNIVTPSVRKELATPITGAREENFKKENFKETIHDPQLKEPCDRKFLLRCTSKTNSQRDELKETITTVLPFLQQDSKKFSLHDISIDSDDLVQQGCEMIISKWERIQAIPSAERVKFIRTCFKNVCLDVVRKVDRNKKHNPCSSDDRSTFSCFFVPPSLRYLIRSGHTFEYPCSGTEESIVDRLMDAYNTSPEETFDNNNAVVTLYLKAPNDSVRLTIIGLLGRQIFRRKPLSDRQYREHVKRIKSILQKEKEDSSAEF